MGLITKWSFIPGGCRANQGFRKSNKFSLMSDPAKMCFRDVQSAGSTYVS